MQIGPISSCYHVPPSHQCCQPHVEGEQLDHFGSTNFRATSCQELPRGFAEPTGDLARSWAWRTGRVARRRHAHHDEKTTEEWWAHSRPAGSGSGRQLHYDLDEVDLRALEASRCLLPGGHVVDGCFLMFPFFGARCGSLQSFIMRYSSAGSSYTKTSPGLVRAVFEWILGGEDGGKTHHTWQVFVES